MSLNAEVEAPSPSLKAPPAGWKGRWRDLRRSGWFGWRGLAPIVLLVAVLVPTLRYRWSEARAGALWGFVLLAAFMGWGRALGARLRPNGRLGWGLEAALGMALFLWVGAALAVVHGFSKVTVWLFVLGGVGALALPRRFQVAASGAKPPARPTLAYAIAIATVGALALLRYGEAVNNVAFNVWDDDMAYRQLTQKLLEVGTLYEPFSSRRIASLGGQTVLDGAMLAGASGLRLHVVDSGICVLVVLGLVFGYGRSRARRIAGMLAAIFFMTMPDPRHNLGSTISGVVFFLALFRLFDAERTRWKHPWGEPIAVGLVAAAASTLRQPYLAAAGVTVFFNYLLRWWQAGSRQARREVIRDLGRTGLATFVALVPWLLTSFANARTFLFPLFAGNSNPRFGFLGKVSWWEEDRWILINIFWADPIRSIAVLVIAGWLVGASRRAVAIRAQLFGAIIGFLALVHSLQASIYHDSVARYYFSFLVAYALALTLYTLSRPRLTRTALVPAVLVLVAFGLNMGELREPMLKTFTSWVNGAEKAWVDRNPDKKRQPDGNEVFYRDLQATVPPGARMVVMLDHPFLFDFRRNDILTLDQPGAVSPPPHLPFFKGPEPVAAYFMGLGVRYLAFLIGQSSHEYQYGAWRHRSEEVIAPGARGGMYKSQARYYLDAFDNFMALTTTRKVLFHQGEYWVLDLGTHV